VDPAEDLSYQLWIVRELLEQLVYKLDVQGLLLRANRSRWMPMVCAEIEAIRTAINDVEQVRAACSATLAIANGLPPDVSLGDLVAAIDGPWSSLLAEHRMHLLTQQGEVEEMSRLNHELAQSGILRTREIIASLHDNTVDVYDPRGHAKPLLPGSLRLDRTF
jgi:hypothetical protein